MNKETGKRALDVSAALLGLLITSPLWVLVAVAIVAEGGPPVFFQQERMGRGRRAFRILKFRTMVRDAETRGPAVTAAGDRRVTRVGRWLRRTKLDELPQLWMVLRGDMSLVGPRPELPRYWDFYPKELQPVLEVKPGITDLAALYYRHEETLLARASDREAYYREVCLPAKLAMSLAYAQRRSLADDARIILRTVFPQLELTTRAEREVPGIFEYYLTERQTLDDNPQSNRDFPAEMSEAATGKYLGQAAVLWLHRNRPARVISLLFLYSAIVFVAYIGGYLIRYEFRVPPEEWLNFLRFIGLIVVAHQLLLAVFKQFAALLSYFSLPDAERIACATASASLLEIGIWYSSNGENAPPRSVILVGFLLSTVGIAALRLAFRRLRERPMLPDRLPLANQRIAIIGAGDAGALLAKEMLARSHHHMQPVAFFDDDPAKHHTQLHGIPIIGAPEQLRKLARSLSKVIIAVPEAPAKRIRELVHLVKSVGLRAEMIPSFDQLVSGKVYISQIRPVEITDLLGRSPVLLETAKITGLVRDRVVLVTGAGGSIGSELSRQIASYGPKRLLLVERCEVQLFQVEQELSAVNHGTEVIPLVTDILDDAHMREVMRQYAPSLVFHAAAHKHVPLMEHQPSEAFRNNSIGTKKVADLAAEFGVESFVLISTDKAVNPTSVMGATKRLAEVYLQALQRRVGSSTRFMTVRFGNVLGSSGSVFHTFKRQIAAGGPVTVTHPDMTRYFMTVQEAAGLVLQSATLGHGGDIFMLDMGDPIRIVDIARQLIDLSGFEPDTDIEIKFTGLRPGEKLYEETNYDAEHRVPTRHAKIFRIDTQPAESGAVADLFERFESRLLGNDTDGIKKEFQRIIPEYTPFLNNR
jgi:FlaA1/EpsC-like NDP-sugar epimerase/lipopolysaccharide/colanic/teichoic acid biosynthesis glycosyltransferase